MLLMEGAPFLFDPQGAFLLLPAPQCPSWTLHTCTCADRKVFLTSGAGTLSLYFSRAQLLQLALPLECLGENKASVLLHLTNTSCPAQGPVCLQPTKHKQSLELWAHRGVPAPQMRWCLLLNLRLQLSLLTWPFPLAPGFWTQTVRLALASGQAFLLVLG